MSTKLVATAASLKGPKKNNFKSFVYGLQSSANPAYFVNTGPVDVEIKIG